MKLKSTIATTKNSLNSRIELIENRGKKLKDPSIDINQYEQKQKNEILKKLKRTDSGSCVSKKKKTNIYVIGVPHGE